MAEQGPPIGASPVSATSAPPSGASPVGATPIEPPVSTRPPDLPFAAAPSASTASPSTLESGNGSAASEGSGRHQSNFDPIAFRQQWKADQVAKIDEQLRRKKFGGAIAGENVEVDVVQGDERKKLLMARDYLMRDQRAKEAFTLSVEPGKMPERTFAATRLTPPEGQQQSAAEFIMDDRRAKLYDDYNRYAEAASKISGDGTLPGMRFTKKERDSRIEAGAWDSRMQNQYEAAVLEHASQSLRGRELLLEENVAKYGVNETLKAEAEEIVAGKQFLAQEWAAFAKKDPRSFDERLREEAQKLTNVRTDLMDSLGLDAVSQMEAAGEMFKQGGAEVMGNAMVGLGRLIDFGDDDEYTRFDQFADFIHDNQKNAKTAVADRFKQPIYSSEGGFNAESVLPQLAQGAGQMSAFAGTGAVTGGGGLFAVAAVSEYENFVQQAIDGGATEKQAERGAMVYAPISAAIERFVNPQLWGSNPAIKEGFQKAIVEGLKQGLTPRNAMKEGFQYIAQQAGQETAEEILQTLAERGTNAAVNELAGTDLNTRITAEEVVNMAIVSSVLGAAGGLVGVPGKRAQERATSQARAEAAQWASINPEEAKAAVQAAQSIPEGEKKAAVERIDILSRLYKGNGLTDKDPKVAYAVAQNIVEKQALKADIKAAPMDETLAEAAGDPREGHMARLDQENMKLLGLKKPEEKVDAEGKVIEEEVKPEPAPEPIEEPEAPTPIVEMEPERTDEEFMLDLVASLREPESETLTDFSEGQAVEPEIQQSVSQTFVPESLTKPDVQRVEEVAPPQEVAPPAEATPVAAQVEETQAPRRTRTKREQPPVAQSATPTAVAVDQPYKRQPPKSVDRPLMYTPASFVTAYEGDTPVTIRGAEYLLPGFEEYRFLVGKDDEGKWGVYEMSTGLAVESGFETSEKAQKGAMDLLGRAGKAKLDKLLSAWQKPQGQPVDPVAPSAKYSEKAKKIAEKVRRGKIKGGVTGAIIPPQLWNATLEVVAKTIKAGGKAIDAIDAALKYLKSTDWWKGAMAEERKAAEARVRGMEDALTEWRSLKPEAPKTATNKSSGVTKPKNLLTVDERTALKDQIRMAVINSRAGAKSNAQEQEAFAATIKDILEPLTGRMTPAQVKTIATRAAGAVTAGKRARFVQYAAKIIDKANYAENLSDAEDLRRSIRKAATRKTAKKRRGSGVNALAIRFAALDPEDAPDIQVYLGMAENLLENLRGYQARVVDGSAIKETGTGSLNTDALLQMLDAHEAAGEAAAQQRIADEYQALVEAGEAPAGLSPQEVAELLSAVESEEDLQRMQSKEDKRALREAATLAMAASRRIDLQQYLLEQRSAGEDADLSPTELALLDDVLGIEIDRLNETRKLRYITLIGDVIHAGDTGGLRDFASIYKAHQGIAKAFAQKGDQKWRSVKDGIRNSLAAQNSFFEWVTKGIDSAWKLRNWIGIDGMNDANQRASRETAKFRQQMNSAIASAGIKHHEAQSYRMRARMGMYAVAIQHRGGTPEQRQQEFLEAKEMIRQSIETRLSPLATDAVRRKGEIEQEAYNALLATANTPDELRANAMRDDKRIIPVVDAAIDGFEQSRDKNFESFKLDFNENPEEWENYTPRTQVKVVGESASAADQSGKDFLSDKYMTLGAVKPKRGSASYERAGGLRTGYALDLDFIGNIMDKFHEAAYKADVSQHLAVVREFMADPRSIDLLTPDSHKTLLRNLRHTVKLQTGELDSTNPGAQSIMRKFDRVSRRAAGIALKGVMQIPKQAMVSINTALNLGTDSGLMAPSGGDALKSMFMPDSPQRAMIDQFQVSSRGETMAGLEKIGDAIRGGPPSVSNAPEAMQWLNSKMGEYSRLTDKVFLPLVGTDVFSARTAWFAYYRQQLRRGGKEFTGWDKEAATPDQEAASYANHMVERTQGANSPSTTPIAYNSPDATRILMKLLLPFSSFPMNQRMRFVNDTAVLLGRDRSAEDRKQAGADMLGTLLETTSYNALKIYAISALAAAGGTAIANAIFGEGDDEEKETQERMKKAREEKRRERLIGTVLSDYLIGGMPGYPRSVLEGFIRNQYRSIAPLRNVDGEEKLPNSIFYGVSDGPELGVFGALADELTSLQDNAPLAIQGTYPRIDEGTFSTFDDLETQLLKQKRGVTGEYDAEFTEDHPLTPEEQAAARYLSLWSALAIIGVSDAEIRSMNRQVADRLRREMAKTHGEIKEGARRFVPAE